MVRFMILTFAVLGWSFYELSGGADFAPPEVVPAPRIAYAEPRPPAPAPATPEVIPAAYAEPVVTTASEFASDAPPVAEAVATPEAAPEPEPAAEVRTVVGSRVNMRQGPGTNHPVVTVLSRGEPTEVIEVDGRWARIRSGEAEGWMALSMLSEPA